MINHTSLYHSYLKNWNLLFCHFGSCFQNGKSLILNIYLQILFPFNTFFLKNNFKLHRGVRIKLNIFFSLYFLIFLFNQIEYKGFLIFILLLHLNILYTDDLRLTKHLYAIVLIMILRFEPCELPRWSLLFVIMTLSQNEHFFTLVTFKWQPYLVSEL